MKLLAFTEKPDHVSYRYRLGAYASALERHGWTIEEMPLAPGLAGRLRQLRQAAEADAVVLQRKLLPLWQLRTLRRAAKVIVYDVDDALFVRDSFHRKGHASWNRLICFWATVYAADLVTAGNGFLADRAGRYVGEDRVRLAPTCVDPSLYRPADHGAAGRRARLAWIGQASTMHSLQHVLPHLLQTAEEVPSLELRVLCDCFPSLDGIRVVPRTWTREGEAAELAQADIGVSWLPDDPWSQGKCGLKVLQYMAAGLPVVANPIGVHRQMVLDGRTGFLAETPAQWSAAIARLEADPVLRQRMGSAGRQLVEREYDTRVWGERFASMIDAVARRPSPAQGAPNRARAA